MTCLKSDQKYVIYIAINCGKRQVTIVKSSVSSLSISISYVLNSSIFFRYWNWNHFLLILFDVVRYIVLYLKENFTNLNIYNWLFIWRNMYIRFYFRPRRNLNTTKWHAGNRHLCCIWWLRQEFDTVFETKDEDLDA